MDRTDPRYTRAVKQVRQDPLSSYCFVSGKQIQPGCGDPHHVLPVAQFPEWAYEPTNIVIVDRLAHDILTEGDPAKVAKLPRIHNLLARMRSLDQSYYEQFKLKITPWMILQNGWA